MRSSIRGSPGLSALDPVVDGNLTRDDDLLDEPPGIVGRQVAATSEVTGDAKRDLDDGATPGRPGVAPATP